MKHLRDALKVNNFLKSHVFIISISILTMAMVFSMRWFSGAVKSELVTVNKSYLLESADLYGQVFQIKLENQIAILECKAKCFENVNLDDYTQFKNGMSLMNATGEFKEIFVANTAGMTLNFHGELSENISTKEYFKKAIKGEISISENLVLDEDGEEVLVLAVPIIQQEKVAGVIVETFSREVLSELFLVDTFDGQGYGYVMDPRGNVIISTENNNKLLEDKNCFEFLNKVDKMTYNSIENIKRDVIGREGNFFQYTYGKDERIGVYSPIEVHDWYVISILPVEIVSTQQVRIIQEVSIFIMIVLIIICILEFLTVKIFVKKEVVERSNERYRIVNLQTQSVIFEFDFLLDKLILNGNTEFIFNKSISQLNRKEMIALISKVHVDDKSIKTQISNFLNSAESTFSSEFRIFCSDEKYYWFKLQCSVIRDDEKIPLKLVGNLINVNEQVIQEERLKNMAEKDLLTGLFNKKTMEKNSQEFLETAKNNNRYVLYMVDLDNFKNINDTLGHIIGDEVLCEVSRMLGRIFSEKDYIGRVGGDEFAILLRVEDSSQNVLEKIVEEKAKLICKSMKKIYRNRAKEADVSVSVGIAIFPEQGNNYTKLYENADIALYKAKQRGKNRYVFFDESYNM